MHLFFSSSSSFPAPLTLPPPQPLLFLIFFFPFTSSTIFSHLIFKSFFSRDLSPQEIIADSLISEERYADTQERFSRSASTCNLPIAIKKKEIANEKEIKKGNGTKKKGKTADVVTGTKARVEIDVEVGPKKTIRQNETALSTVGDGEDQRVIGTLSVHRETLEEKEVECSEVVPALGTGVGVSGGVAGVGEVMNGILNADLQTNEASPCDIPSLTTVIEWRAESEVLAWTRSALPSPRTQKRGPSHLSFSIGVSR